MPKVALVGTGAIGRSWAIVFAETGHRTTLWDPVPGAVAAALRSIEAQLATLAAEGRLADGPDAVLARLHAAPDLPAALDDADYVQENGPEALDTRRALFATLDRLAPPDAVLASSTSGMTPGSFAADLPGRARCLVAHPANPPHLLKLVELCPAPFTAPAVVERASAILRGAGRAVARLGHEIEGFLLNRLQGALLAEAFRLVADGVAEPDDIDTVMTDALGLRWAFMGPFETVDLNAPGGIGDFCQRYGALYERLQRDMPPRAWDPALVARVEAARRAALPANAIAARQDWRDRRLAALLRHRDEQPER